MLLMSIKNLKLRRAREKVSRPLSGKTGKKKYGRLTGLIILLVCLGGCGEKDRDKTAMCSVVLEECEGVSAGKESTETPRGEDVSFVLKLKQGYILTGTDYKDYELKEENENTVLTLKNVRYSTVVKLNVSYEYRIYYPNGGLGKAVKEASVTGVNNTRTEAFVREGYIQTGWNTEPDGSGDYIGFGSRSQCDELYAVWAKETDESLFSYICSDESATVTGYYGREDRCVLPDTLGGLPVRVIAQGAFENAEFTEFVCPDTVQIIEDGAFKNADVVTLTLFDNLLQLSDKSFQGCPIKTLYLNARRAPVYAGSYFSAFPDKCERLFSLEGKKIVLFSGSSGRYGYNSQKIEEAFEEYEVVNMGTYAYTNALPQLDIIFQAVNENDILIEAPEFDAPVQQFCESDRLDRFFFSLVETDYKLASLLDIQQYTGVFDALNEYLYEHSRMAARDYSYLASEYDDDGNRIDYPTYNKYGDYTLKRPNSEKDEMHRAVPADYTTDTITAARISALNEELLKFTEKGVKVLFSYAPRNRSSLTESSTGERIEETEQLICEMLSVPVISKIEDYFYSGIYFYEIDNHLSDEGVELRTEQLIADLAEWMERSAYE